MLFHKTKLLASVSLALVLCASLAVAGPVKRGEGPHVPGFQGDDAPRPYFPVVKHHHPPAAVSDVRIERRHGGDMGRLLERGADDDYQGWPGGVDSGNHDKGQAWLERRDSVRLPTINDARFNGLRGTIGKRQLPSAEEQARHLDPDREYQSIGGIPDDYGSQSHGSGPSDLSKRDHVQHIERRRSGLDDGTHDVDKPIEFGLGPTLDRRWSDDDGDDDNHEYARGHKIAGFVELDPAATLRSEELIEEPPSYVPRHKQDPIHVESKPPTLQKRQDDEETPTGS
ncbi:uncharacterized protein SRS1_11293 [Sporisorium reilianum f. sp. reilianum]|uniref:Secreted protein n=1 Tax=Sporisorium reilianum f. sp. reilianum TaxID=72559 RepID=A0A2N8UNK8_9BASI|nr:uncharacterized protein SRS1_11293 [Sporisorium reilianum f. sp. reilianum]